MGWIKHSDSKFLRTKWIDPYINLKKLKKVIRRESKCRSAKANQQYFPESIDITSSESTVYVRENIVAEERRNHHVGFLMRPNTKERNTKA